MTVNAIRLVNFRGFRDSRLELKPLTVLLGANSSGKSSFGHALAAMAHAHRYYAGGPQASLAPLPQDSPQSWPVDLGRTSDLRTTGASGPVRVGLHTSAGWVELGFGAMAESEDRLDLSSVSFPTGDRTIAVPTANVPSPHLTLGSTSGSVPLETRVPVSDSRVELRRANPNQWMEGSIEVFPILQGLVLNALRQQSGTARPVSVDAMGDVQHLFRTVSYLRANRRRPSRRYENSVDRQQEIGYSGEWTPTILHRYAKEKVSYGEILPVPRTASELTHMNRGWSIKSEPLAEAVSSWLTRLGLAQRAESVKRSDTEYSLNITPLGQSARDITELGFGVSQVLPILIAGLRQPLSSLLIVDLPEAHLHPRPQGILADFFCALALSGRSSLVETHSEMFFHQLRLRAALHPELREKIAVYFIDSPRDGVCCNPREVGLGPEDEVRWPEGFLHEAWEAETLILAAARENSRAQ